MKQSLQLSNSDQQYKKMKPRTVRIYSKANWEGMRHDMLEFQSSFLSTCEGKNTEQLWQELKSEIDQIGSLPSEWLKANVSPIFKKGEKSDPANYRPISLTCILCKIFEHIVASF